ncbi:hypothetical protein ABIE13_002466 [Ottowia thiooxydans]|uniref:Uncharacterized protein n=1 Tax=Ottowia thiooxydans TaxID=219182 RepID=A0ABV2Q8J8_9BURK
MNEKSEDARASKASNRIGRVVINSGTMRGTVTGPEGPSWRASKARLFRSKIHDDICEIIDHRLFSDGGACCVLACQKYAGNLSTQKQREPLQNRSLRGFAEAP